ncbi:hypothetical protein WH87_04175 [Devosia epidermidihirudinis]|uniref:Carboxyltransferase domain-containing protein n=1 Tax=Devosia epidermidihirudinis TaxID=1293439 RepID=A0A0F5QHB8_9HYPH|nr:carboxyltransferase domain-containing protein [Devosia epidermidihirudinis]KKC39419.1 hypothetical protein WH87_04175 [Devosia epidermidihirudinis]
MVGPAAHEILPTPTIIPLGDAHILVRFGTRLTDDANRAAIALAMVLADDPIPDVLEVVSNLVSVLLRYDPMVASPAAIGGELRLRLNRVSAAERQAPASQIIGVHFGGADGPDLAEVAALVGMSPEAFISAHNAAPLRVLSTGFAPGFLYCGLHADMLTLPRRKTVRPLVPKGSILFAAGQTAITATEMPTGWHVIGRTEFDNFDPTVEPPTRLRAGDAVIFEAI